MPRTLTTDEREFFRTVADAGFSNPFGTRRAKLDAQILGLPTPLPHAERSARLRTRLAAEVDRLERDGIAHLDSHGPEDRALLEVAFLFLGYQESFADLDAHIDAALAAARPPASPAGRAPLPTGKGPRSRRGQSGETAKITPATPPTPRPFAAAPEHLARLRRRGFTEEEADRYLAIFFQLRRAHRFIDQGLVGRSSAMIELRRQLWNAAVSADMRVYGKRLFDRMEDFSTLILGETGSGKGRAAEALGRSGFIPFDRGRGTFVESFAGAFLSINLSQYTEGLLPSELFGHRKGAFTGAIDDHVGVFSECSPYGSILLDEIGEVSVPVQIQLLRVLQERTFSPVGSTEELRFRGRVIAATNQSITERRRDGSFRDDFYYRLSSDVITVPPLSVRIDEDPGELEVLVEVLMTRIVGESAPLLTERVLASLAKSVPRDYPWPGNVRELEQAVRRILLTRRYEPEMISEGRTGGGLDPDLLEGAPSARELVARYCALLYRESGNLAEVGRRTGLDRRTVRKHLVEEGEIPAERPNR